MIVYESDLKSEAISAMENCRAFVLNGEMERAHYYRGKASAYEDMLADDGIDLSEGNSYYAALLEDYLKATSREIRV